MPRESTTNTTGRVRCRGHFCTAAARFDVLSSVTHNTFPTKCFERSGNFCRHALPGRKEIRRPEAGQLSQQGAHVICFFLMATTLMQLVPSTHQFRLPAEVARSNEIEGVQAKSWERKFPFQTVQRGDNESCATACVFQPPFLSMFRRIQPLSC